MPTHPAASGPHVLRRMNAVAVLGALRAAEPPAVSVTDLVAATGLSRPAVTRALAGLDGSRLVESVTGDADAPGQIGRPAQRVRFRSELGHVAGVDIGPHKVLVMVADLSGRVLATHRSPAPPGADGPRLFAAVRDALRGAAAEAGVPLSGLWAVSVGTPGIVDPDRGEVLLAPSIPGWAGLPVVPRLREWLHCPVLIDNDVDLAVLGERWRGAATDADNLVFVQWGERIGTGIVINGRPYRGAAGAAGELGFVDLTDPSDPSDDPPARPLTDGLGPFEDFAAAAAVRRHAREAGAPLGDGDDMAPLFAAAAAGDPVAVAVVDRSAARFARGLATLLLLLDPGLVVIGGGLSRAGETLLAPLRHHLRRHTLVTTEVTASALGDHAVAVGAVRRALDAVEPRLTAAVAPD